MHFTNPSLLKCSLAGSERVELLVTRMKLLHQSMHFRLLLLNAMLVSPLVLPQLRYQRLDLLFQL